METNLNELAELKELLKKYLALGSSDGKSIRQVYRKELAQYVTEPANGSQNQDASGGLEESESRSLHS